MATCTLLDAPAAVVGASATGASLALASPLDFYLSMFKESRCGMTRHGSRQNRKGAKLRRGRFHPRIFSPPHIPITPPTTSLSSDIVRDVWNSYGGNPDQVLGMLIMLSGEGGGRGGPGA